MATADEILATMAEEAAETGQADEVCTIDRCTRAVTIPEALRIVGVETDKDVTRRQFRVLCSYRGTNLSTFRIRIHFMNANKEKDIYYVTDAAQDGEYLTFSWVISRKATKYKGKLKFIACMVCDGGTDEEREWNSTLGEFTVLEGLEVELTDGEEEQARDAITQLLAVIDARESEAVEAVSAQGATQVAAVRAAGAQQEASIAAKGAATLETIPDDYTTLHNNVAALTKEVQQFAISDNRLDIDAITSNCYVDTDGITFTSQNFSVTDFIPVVAGETLRFCANRGTEGYMPFDVRLLCAYDDSKNAVPASGGNYAPGYYIVPDGIAYVRLSISNTYLSSWTNFYVGNKEDVDLNSGGYVGYGESYLPVKLSVYSKAYVDSKLKPIEDTLATVKEQTHTVSSGGSILEGLIYCYANNIRKLVVEAGTYDVIAEYEAYYGADYFTNYENYATDNVFDRGLWLENIEVVFSAGAKVVCYYTGDNENVSLYFSAFATGNNVTIDGLVLDSENLRYGIHADYNSGANQTNFIVKNCDLRHYKSAESNQAIGAGTGRHVLWLIENTIFRSDANAIVFRIHNNVSADAQSKVIVKDCYIEGDGYFRFNSYSNSELPTIIQVCGCSYKNAPVLAKETIDSNDNFVLVAWNNEVRTD